jgi:16S rRNA (cytosine967-C5)-methyltransferase
MRISPAREIAYRILRRIEDGRGFAVDLLQAPVVWELKEADRRLATELVMGVLRWRGELDFQIERLTRKPLKRLDPEVATILRLGIYQIKSLAKIPKAAAVNEAVELTKAARKRSAAGLVNAALRRCTPPAQRLSAQHFGDLNSESLASVRHAIPDWLFDRWQAKFGGEDSRGPNAALPLAWASLQVPPTTLRVTGGQADFERVRRELEEMGIHARPGQFAPDALLVESGQVQGSAALREGRVVIQDEASQLVAGLLAPQAGQRVLDVCAAPGMKAGHIARALRRGTLVACDASATRLRTMARLLPKMVPPEVRLSIVQLDAARALPFATRFGRILVDAPCSGTGTLARNPEILWRLQPRDLSRLADLQKKILSNALPLLAPGGRLVYATCSLEPEENEEVAQTALKAAGNFRQLTREELCHEFPALTPLFDAAGYFRTRPDAHHLDGFFAVVLTRIE